MTLARIIVPGATTMITKRTTMRKAFLAPWHPAVNAIRMYALAYAQRKYEVAIHTGSMPVNHQHLMATPTHANLPMFVGQFHGDMSKAINALLAREKYDAPRELLDKRSPHYLRLMDSEAQATTAQYVHLNCVAAGLVARPEHMPGFQFDFDLWKTRFVEVPRPDVFFEDERPETLVLEVTPPPLLYEAFGGDIDSLVAHMKELEREQIYRLRAKHKRGPLGAQRLTRIHPWDEPKTLRETGGRPVPTFRYGARSTARVQLEVEGAHEVHRFHRDYDEVRVARRDGNCRQAFPFGAYKERVVHGAPVAPPPEPGDAAVAMPGPTLADIEAKLVAQAAQAPVDLQATATQVEALVETARGALTAESQEMAAGAHDDVGEFRATANATDAGRHVVTLHRFDRKQSTAGSRPARVITKRDRRRGRPAASQSKHGTDPPA